MSNHLRQVMRSALRLGYERGHAMGVFSDNHENAFLSASCHFCKKKIQIRLIKVGLMSSYEIVGDALSRCGGNEQ